MKENRFIELVNLYVDRQISPAETAELEAEIQASPRRRKIYQQYCHMQRATKLVYESFRANAEQPVAAPSRSGGSIAQFEYSRKRSHWGYAVGGIAAAAACIAVIVARTGSFSPSPNTPGLASTQPKAAVVASVPAPAEQPAANPLAAQEAKAAAAEQQFAAQLSAKRQEEMRAFAVAQQRATQPMSLFADEGLDSRQFLNAETQKVFQLKRKTDRASSTEVTAFQFQR